MLTFRAFVGKSDDGTLNGDAVPLRGCFVKRVSKGRKPDRSDQVKIGQVENCAACQYRTRPVFVLRKKASGAMQHSDAKLFIATIALCLSGCSARVNKAAAEAAAAKVFDAWSQKDGTPC